MRDQLCELMVASIRAAESSIRDRTADLPKSSPIADRADLLAWVESGP